MSHTADVFGRERALVGMIHLEALPGTPRARLPLEEVADRAAAEALTLVESGFDALLVENSRDLPFLRGDVGHEITASMTTCVRAVREAVDAPVGVQVLAGANQAALAVAHAAGARFIRAEGFVFASIADEGLLEEADAGPLLRYRRAIGAESIHVLADVKKKHSAHAITADVDVAEMTRTAELVGADGVIITGIATGRPIRLDDLGCARLATTLPLVVGSGVTPDSVQDLFAYADALIVGSWYKERGDWLGAIDAGRAAELVKAVNAAR